MVTVYQIDTAYDMGRAEGARAATEGRTTFRLDYGALANALGVNVRDIDVPHPSGYSIADGYVSGAQSVLACRH